MAVPVTVAAESPSNPPFPGGGRILYAAQSWLGSADDGAGVVSADGSTQLFGSGQVDAMWNPGTSSQVLLQPLNVTGASIRRYRLKDGEWTRSGRISVGGSPFFEVAPDGRRIAYSRFHRGRMTGEIRVADRTGDVSALVSNDLYPVSWADRWRLVLSDWGVPGDLFLWDTRTRDVRPFLSTAELALVLPPGSRSISMSVGAMSWSSDGRLFALPVDWSEGRSNRGAVIVGDASGSVRDVVALGRREPEPPTWSPARPELAVLSSSRRNGLPESSSTTPRRVRGPCFCIRLEGIGRHGLRRASGSWWTTGVVRGGCSCLGMGPDGSSTPAWGCSRGGRAAPEPISTAPSADSGRVGGRAYTRAR